MSKYTWCILTQFLFTVCDNNNAYLFVEINTEEISQNRNAQLPKWTRIRYFYYQHTKYIWDPEKNMFSSIDDIMPAQTVDDYLDNHEGLEQDEYQYR